MLYATATGITQVVERFATEREDVVSILRAGTILRVLK